MSSALHHAHDGRYLIGVGSVGCAVFPEGAIVVDGPPPGWPIGACPSARHRWNIETCTWDEMPLPLDEAWAQVRYKRDGLLSATDWMVSRASETGGQLAYCWREYRQALRDITDQPDPLAIAWPEPPRE